ncbi:MAG TPA: hypothetical protein VGJ39_16020 [Vicinamibacterales bacterium]|jgi:tetratricopeptide (TPR) repeat protein
MVARILVILGGACWFACVAHPTTWPERYDKALKELTTAQDDLHRFYSLADVAKAAFEVGKTTEAAEFAQQILTLAPRFRDDWNYGNAIHDGHMVLGRVALRNDDVDAAERELLAAGATPGSPQLDSFGPNVSLARDLLEKKQVNTVIEYFQLCAKFWELEDGRLTRWTVVAKAGEMPDFGANLLY